MPTWLTERGADAHALVRVAQAGEPTGWAGTEAPRGGESGFARLGAALTRITLKEITHGRQQTLRRWLQRDDTVPTLTIISADLDGLREHTPGKPAAQLMGDPAGDEAQLTDLPADWLDRRGTDAPQGLKSLVVDVPVLKETAHWLLDQIALRGASAQQLRAVLEPDLTDYLHDRQVPCGRSCNSSGGEVHVIPQLLTRADGEAVRVSPTRARREAAVGMRHGRTRAGR
ncbi:hypothetical protein [Streptomyces atrovirens]|uniref:hypothetical protein n=1 Tax=Streptomyces atrovirens TaxID=285556 RepID=UPI0036D3EB66